VVGDADSVTADSFARGLLDYPHYTRPAEYRGLSVPDVLLSGHHGRIAEWRRREAVRRTLERRPDLLRRATLDEAEQALIKEFRRSGK
jgi:tRNA (guanine37-N1)-methyltransferase